MTFNKHSIENKIISICDYLNLNKNFDSFLNWILELRQNLNIPHKLSDLMDCNNIDLENGIRNYGHKNVTSIINDEDIYKIILKKINKYQIIIFLGAGNITKIANNLKNELEILSK